MSGLLISILILLLILVLVHVLCDNLPGIKPHKNIIMIVVLVIGAIYILRGVVI